MTNSIGRYGGQIYIRMQSDKYTFDSNTITGNEARTHGGAVYYYEDDTNKAGEFVISSTTGGT